MYERYHRTVPYLARSGLGALKEKQFDLIGEIFDYCYGYAELSNWRDYG